MAPRRLALIVAAIVSLSCTACGATFATQPAVPDFIVVTGLSPALGGTSQLTVTTTLTDRSTQNVTSQSKYQVANPAIATVSASGVVTGVAAGSTIITATYQQLTAGLTITVR